MPLDESLLGGSVPFDPREAAENMINRAAGDPLGTPIDTDMAIDRLTRKLMRLGAGQTEPEPAAQVKPVKAKEASGPDLSDMGIPADQVEDLSSLGTPADQMPQTPAAPPPAAAQPPKHNAFMRGFVSGMAKENPEGLSEALEGISHLAPKDFKGAFQTGAKDIRALADSNVAKEYAKTGKSMWDIAGIDDALTWAGETFGSGLASTVPSVALGLGGAVVGGRIAGKPGAMVGGAAGATVPSAMLNYGGVYKALKDEKVDPEKAAEYAAYATVPMTALDVGSLGPIIARLGGMKEVQAQLSRAIAKRIAQEAAKGAGREGITEGIQDVIQSATVSLASGKPFWTAETAKSALENAAGGALVGGGLGGASGIKSDNIAQPAPQTPSGASGLGPAAAPAPGAGPQPSPGSGPAGTTGAGPSGPQSSPEDIADFVRRAKESNPSPDTEQPAAGGYTGPDPATMTEAERVHAYAAARDSHDGARDADILRAMGMSDEQIADLDEQDRIDAVIRATKAPQTKTEQQAAKPSQEDEDYAILRTVGYTDENIADMNPSYRASEVKYYREDIGIDPAEAVRRYPRPQAKPEAQQESASPQAEATIEPASDKNDSFFVRSSGDRGDMLHVSLHPDRVKVDVATVGKKTRGQGVAVSLYEKAAQFAASKGLPLRSDLSVSADAAHVYEALKRRGYTVTEAPGTLTHKDGGKINAKAGYVFEVHAPKADAADGSRTAPIKATTADDVVRASEQVADPTPAQAQAENYKHGHLDLDTLGLTGRNNISIETGVGQLRKGIDADGKAWEVRMPVAYGRIKGTKGADGQPLDIFIGPNPHSPHVFIVNQNMPNAGGFDEHKILAGFMNPRAALEAYKGSYKDQGGDRIGSVTAISADAFKDWLKSGDHTAPFQKKEPASLTHDKEAGSTTPFTEAPVGEGVPKEEAPERARPTSASETDNTAGGENVPADQSGDVEILPPDRVMVEPTQEHHDQIEAVLGRDYDHVLPVDAVRAAEILAANEGMAPETAFGQAVIENAVAQGYLTEQEAIDAYGTEVKDVLESEQQGASERSGDTASESAGADEKPAGGAEETGIVSGGRETGAAARGESEVREQPDTKRDTAEQPDTGSEAVNEAGRANAEASARHYFAMERATDERWGELVDATVDQTRPGDIFNAVKLNITFGNLSIPNARALMKAMGDEEIPKAESIDILARSKIEKLQGGERIAFPYKDEHQQGRMWATIVGIEDGYLKKNGSPTKKLRDLIDNPPPPLPEPEGRIEDAGEKIGGARKDEWIGRGLESGDLSGMTGAELDRFVTKHNVWHRPDYTQAVEDGVDPVAAALIKQIYDGVSVKPNPGRYGNIGEDEQKLFIQVVSAVREAASTVKTVDQVKLISDKVDHALRALKADLWDALTLIKRGKSRISPLYVSGIMMRKAERMVREGFPNLEPWQRLFMVRDKVLTWKDGKPVDRRYIVVRRNGGTVSVHNTREEAEAAAKAAYDALGEARKQGGEEPKRPHLDQVERSGPDYRGGRDVGSEDFIKDFGFRGVEFGNWVAGDERQKVVNLAYDALNDLARVLGLPPKAMSLDGTLAVAFGARGRGGRAAAHYESDRTVINMTKLSGAGSLAHEWGHALDHYLGEIASKTPYKGAVQSLSGWRTTPPAPTSYFQQSDFHGVNRAMPVKLRVAGNRLMHTLFATMEDDAAFEARVSREIEKAKQGQAGWMRHVDMIKARMAKGGSRAGLKEAEHQVEVWGRSIQRAEALREKGRRRAVESQFYKEATRLSGATGDYWRRPNELFARSFESYVFDKIAAQGFASQYLVQGVEESRYGAGFKGNPYPSGAERDAINAAYDRLFRALTTVEGKLGAGTRLQGAEGQPEPVETVTPVARPQAQPSAKQEADAVAESSKPQTLKEAFAAHFGQGGSFESIVAARKFAKDTGFSDDPKVIEEAIEAAVVETARGDIALTKSRQTAYKALVNLYNRQPRLGTRTSTSVRDQAYSTPVPLAYLASKLAGITDQTTVYEPTAGNGALLIDTDPAKVKANEVNPDRAAQLREQGYKVQSYDASNKGQFAGPKSVDVVIANPPFGPVKEGGESKVFDLSDIQPGYSTTEIDHVIALRSLAAMKDDGRAVLLLGGVNKMADTRDKRSDAYNGKAKRQFYKALYDRYGVTDHFTVAGDLYARQGASWPVDVIVIEGRKKSGRALPAADVPRIYQSWDDLGGLIDGVRRQEAGDARPAVGPAAGAAETGAGLADERGGTGVGAGGEQPATEQSGGVRGQRAAGNDEAGGAGAGGEVQSGGGGRSARSGEQPAAERPSSGLNDEFADIFNDALDAAYGTEAAQPAQQDKKATKSRRDTRPTEDVAKSAAQNAADAADAAIPRQSLPLTERASADKERIRRLVTQIIRDLVGHSVEVEFEDGLIPVSVSPGWGRLDTGVARGLFYPMSRIIQIAMQGDEAVIGSTAFHEAYHAMEILLQTPRERVLMERATARLRNQIKRQEGYTADQIDQLSDMEVRAIAFENYMMQRLTGKTRTGYSEPHGILRALFDRIRAFLERLGNGLRGLGYKSADDIFSTAAEGGFRNRRPGFGDEQPMAAMAGGPNSRNTNQRSFDENLGDLVGQRLGAILPALLKRQNMTEVRAQLQDKFIRVKKAEQSVGLTDAALSAYQAESLYYGRTGQRLEAMEDNHIDPIVRELKGRDIDLDDFNDYIYALHVKERNEKIGAMYDPNHQFSQAVNDTSIVGASGVSTDEALDYLDQIRQSGRLADYQAIETMVRNLQQRTLDALLNYGLISQDVYDSLLNEYQFYVPLRGFAEGSEHEETIASGKGYDTRGKEFQMAFGRRSKAAGPLQYIFLQAEMAVVRGEKNRVGNTFLRFVQNNPDPDRWVINRPKVTQRVDKNTGLITSVTDNFADYRDPNVFITKIGGKPYRIELKGPDGANLARALKTMGTTNLHGLVRMIGNVTRVMARLATAWNLNFVIRNFSRDVGEALINLGEVQQQDIAKHFRGHLFKAVVGASRGVAGSQINDRYVQAFHEFDRAGGRVHFFGIEDADDFKRNVDRKMRRLEGGIKNGTLNAVQAVGDVIEVVNGGIENGTRLAAFMAAKDVGMSTADAAYLARNIAINFDRKGELGSAMNALWMFSNVGFQGITRMLQAIRHPRVRRSVYALAGLGAATTLFSMMMGGDDEDKEGYYMQLPPWERDKNLVLLWPKALGKSLEGYGVKIPLPFGYAPFAVLGSHLVTMLMGKETPAAAAAAVAGSFWDAFDPIFHDKNWAAALMPTIIRPAIHIYTNKNWTGKPLYPDNTFAKGPDSQKSFRSNSEFSKAAAAKINEWTGGSTYKPGLVDLHPGTIDHWMQAVSGGAGQFLKQAVASPISAYNGEWQVQKAPLLSGFVAKAGGEQAKNAAYYEARQPVVEKAGEIAKARSDMKRGINVDESRAFIEKNNNAAEANIFKQADSQLRKLREREARVRADTEKTAVEKKAEIEKIRRDMREIQTRARGRLREQQGQGQ